VAAPLAVKLVPVPPLHMLAEAGVTITVGVLLTVIVTVCVLVQLPVVPVTVYVVVIPGLAVTDAPTVPLNPAAGAHVYVEAPLAVRFVPLPPVHMLAAAGVTVTVGVGFTVTTTVAASEQLPVVPVTVYDVVTVGLAVTLAPTVALNPVAGVHE